MHSWSCSCIPSAQKRKHSTKTTFVLKQSAIGTVFSSYLTTEKYPDPELLIRTSGEQRISNFLLWQLAYAEFYFTDTLWPDFDAAALDQAIASYQRGEGRFRRPKQ